MKKLKIFGILIIFLMTIGGCNKNNNEKSSQKLQQEWAEDGNSEPATFNDGTLKTNEAELIIDKTQFVNGSQDGNYGLIVWYTVTNNSKENIVPENLLTYFKITQNDDSSSYNIENDFNFFDSAGALYPITDEDISNNPEAYKSAIDNRNNFNKEFSLKASSELLPNKTVQVATGLTINNLSYPITFELKDSTDSEKYVVNP
ncbi:MAG: DUF5067 domain-containing protein [Streptococcaceae bacterium]|jgi:hypothetical protein|nr:DUF5067 domain-containing protein [Streptococcaceae bacterium]